MTLTARQMVSTFLFAALWTAFMVWWNGDYGVVRIAILFVVGVIIALAWAWGMKRFGGWT